MHVFYDYVASAQGAFRLVFESDLTNEPPVRERVDRVTRECAEAIAEVIHEDTGLPDEQSRLLAVSLVGMAQVSARFWLDTGQRDLSGGRGYARRRAGLARHPGLPALRRAALTRIPRHSDTTGGPPVEVKIGVQNANRELVVDSSETADEVEKAVSRARSAATAVLVLTDSKGRKVARPGRQLAYVEIGTVDDRPGRLPVLTGRRRSSSILIVGTVIGLLGKFVAPGNRDNIPLWLTVVCGSRRHAASVT